MENMEGKISQIRTQTDSIAYALSNVHEGLKELEDRLSIVLVPQGTIVHKEAPKADEPAPLLAPLASELANFADQICTLNNRVQDILQRLEL